ncbi:hypothetical protein ACFUCV_13235 [Specibacter sp. NPDC057265]|uniref:hypothetical protein n=1 Tax=Specibacter sp. NPDC057265 TaxID=3346075 RepID=UPI003645C077
MKHNPEPAIPPTAPQNLDDVYRRGYLDGHLAGWRDAVAAQQLSAREPAPAQPGHADLQTGAQLPTPAGGPAQAVPPTPSAAPVTRAAPVAPELAAGAVAAPAAAAFQATAPGAQQFQAPAAQAPPAQPSPWPQPPSLQAPWTQPATMAVDPQLVAERRQRRETQNINITLYVASLLMVAAAALFVGSTLPPAARLVGVWFGTAVFYAAGLVTHGKVARLRPAAVAFTGTALAIIPFAGIATYNLGFPQGPAVWLFTSFIGTVAYVVAAVRMQSRLIVYTSLAFLLSTVWSSTAVLGAALAWYFAALIVFSALLMLLAQLLERRSRKGHGAAQLYARPLLDLGPWFAPAGLLASLVVGSLLNAADHLLVLVAGVIYFAVLLALPGPAVRGWNYVGLRLCLTLAAPFIGWLMQAEAIWVAGAFALGLALQVLAIAAARTRTAALRPLVLWTSWDLVAAVPAAAVGGLVWTVGLAAENGSRFTAWGLAVALVLGMATVPAFLPRREWLPVPALLAVLVTSPLLTALDWTVLLGIMVGYTVTRWATAGSAWWKRSWLGAARVAGTAFAAAALAAAVPAQPGKVGAILTITAVLCALQLLADASLARTRTANPLTVYLALIWTTAGAFLVVLLSLAVAVPALFGAWGGGSATALRMEFLVAAALMGLAAVAYSAVSLAHRMPVLGELSAPLFLVTAALAVGPVFHAGGAATAWALTVGYLAMCAGMRRDGRHQLHRWCYWWAARLGTLVLATALFQWWAEVDPTTTAAGARVGLGEVLTLALLPQLLWVASAIWQGRRHRWLDVDATLTLTLTVLVAAAWVPGAPEGVWTVLVLLAAVAAAAALLMGAGALAATPMPATRWAAPVALLLLALLGAADPAPLSVVLALAAVTASAVAARAGQLLPRSLYALLARGTGTVLAAALAQLFGAGTTAVSLVLCLALVVQFGLQLLISRRAHLRAAVGHGQVMTLTLWGVLAAQLVLPLAYYGASGGFGASGTGMRPVVVLELAVLAAAAICAQLLLKQRGAAYLSIMAVMGAAAVVAPTLWTGATALGLLALGVAVLVWRCLSTPKSPELQWFWLVATAAMLLTAHVVDAGAALGVFAGWWLLAGLALLAATQLMKMRWLTIPGALLIFIAALLFRAQVLEMTDNAGFSALAGFLVLTGTLYVVRFLMVDLGGTGNIDTGALTASALLGGALFALWAMADDGTVLPGAAAFTVVAAAACFEAPARFRSPVVDAAIIGCALVWFWACSSYVDLGAFWSVQWCAMALAALSVKRYLGGQRAMGRQLLMAASAVASLGALITVFNGNALEQAISLVVFVVLLMVGMGLDERVFTVWGAVGVATAVVWYLRGYTYLLLAVLALALIAFAIWRLNRKKPAPAAKDQSGI